MRSSIFPDNFDFCNRTLTPRFHLCYNTCSAAFIVGIWQECSSPKNLFPRFDQRVLRRKISFVVYNGRLCNNIITATPHFIGCNAPLAILPISRVATAVCRICLCYIFIYAFVGCIHMVYISINRLFYAAVFCISSSPGYRNCMPILSSCSFADLSNAFSISFLRRLAMLPVEAGRFHPLVLRGQISSLGEPAVLLLQQL